MRRDAALASGDDGDARLSVAYQAFMLVVCVYAMAALAAQRVLPLDAGTRAIIDLADWGVCALFFFDFLWNLWRAPNRWRYFASWGWLDLLSSIPMVDATRWGRLARVARVIRVLRALRAARILASLIIRRRAESSFLAASLVALLLVVFSSIAVLHFEADAEGNIKTGEDAFWWALTTVTTVGYGDRFPVTSEGRLIAAVLMCAGVGLFGTFSGFLAAWFLSPPAGKEGERSLGEEVAALRTEVADLRGTLARIEGAVVGERGP